MAAIDWSEKIVQLCKYGFEVTVKDPACYITRFEALKISISRSAIAKESCSQDIGIGYVLYMGSVELNATPNGACPTVILKTTFKRYVAN